MRLQKKISLQHGLRVVCFRSTSTGYSELHQNPPSCSIIPKTYESKVGARSQDNVRPSVTPVSAEALTSLHDLIKQDVHTLNEMNIQRIQRHVQKLANAAQVSFTERALLHDHNQFLTRMNNEARVRRSSKSVIIGKAKVISYEDIEEARAKRAAKEILKDNKKRSRKRNNALIEASKAEPEPEPESELEPVPELERTWRAPVARII